MGDPSLPPATHARAYARVGLLGNPSDGYGGKTLAVTVANYYADVWVTPRHGAGVGVVPHPVHDPTEFASLDALSAVAARDGYSGGVRLIVAGLHRFAAHCAARGVALPARGFDVRYDTTIPRQVGLAGSSAIVTALLRAVAAFYGYGDDAAREAGLGLGRDVLPSFVLAIEAEELGITAGLQDRVVQSYEGCIHMDFDAATMRARGHGAYTRVRARALPPLFLAWCDRPSDSGRIHAPVKQRWLDGDAEVVAGMAAIAALADRGLQLATGAPYDRARTAAAAERVAADWAAAFVSNFDGRRRLFGDAALGADNLRMVAIARECGAAAKLPGSGGAVVGVVDAAGVEAGGCRLPPLPDDGAPPEVQASAAAARVEAAAERLRRAFAEEGYGFVRLRVHEAGEEEGA